MSAVYCADVDEMPSTELMIAIGSPLTNALGIAGSVGSHRLWSQFARAQVLASLARGPKSVDGFASGAAGFGCPVAGADHVAGLGQLRLGGVALGGQLVQLALLVGERLLGRRQRRHRGVLTGLRVDRGLVGLLLGQPCRGFLVDLFGAGPLQIGHDLLGSWRRASALPRRCR